MATRVLVVEDEAQWGESLVRIIESISDTEVVLRPGVGTALASASRSDLDFAFIDLELKGGAKGEFPLFGIELASKIREVNPEIGLVLYSGHIKQGRERQFEFYDECAKLADEVFSRKELLSARSESLARIITRILGKRLTRHVEFAADLNTAASVERISEHVADYLIRKSIPRSSDLRAGILGGGFSESSVFRVEGNDAATGEHLQAVVKISRNRSSLATELEGTPHFGSPDFGTSISAQPELVERRGWWAIAQPFVGNSKTLEEVLLSDNPSDDIFSSVVYRLFETPAGRPVPRPSDRSVENGRWRMTKQFAAEVCSILDKISQNSEVTPPDILHAAVEVATAVRRDTERDFTKRTRGFAMLHGDAHTRNILITDDDSPVLIDLARRAPYPRMFDMAALHVDLVLRLMESIGGRDNGFVGLPAWQREVRTQYPLGNSQQASKDVFGRSISVLTASATRLKDTTPDEYAEALYFQLLRHSRFSSITYPKKCLAAFWSAELACRFFL